MGGNVHVYHRVLILEVHNHQQQFLVGLAQEGILALQVIIHIHQVERQTLDDGLLLACQLQRLLVNVEDLLLVGSQLILRSTTQRVNAPVVEDGCATVVTAEALTVHATLAIFLTGIEHKRILVHQHRGNHAWHTLHRAGGKEVTTDALLVVILQEIHHVVADVVSLLPSMRDGMSRFYAAYHTTHRVIHANLIVEPVETRLQIVTIFERVIHLAHEDDVLKLLLHGLRGVSPEFRRHHLRHVATETVHTLLRPEQQDGSHLQPRIRDGVEMSDAPGIVIHAVVQLHRLIPVVTARGIVEMVVTRSLGGLFQIGLRLATIQVEIRCKTLARTIVKVVLRVKSVQRLVLFAQVLHTTGLADALILTSHMVRHEIDDDLHTGLVGALHQLLKLLHALFHVHRQVGVNVVVVRNGIG